MKSMKGQAVGARGGNGAVHKHALARFATENAVRRQRRVWSGRVASWDQHGSTGLTKVTAAVLEAAGPSSQVAGTLAVDLGCGTGQLSLPLARQGAQVLAVDVSAAMGQRLRSEAGPLGVTRAAAPAT